MIEIDKHRVGRRPVDLTGQVFGRLTALEVADRSRSGHVRWLCKCSCGATVTVSGDDLRRGNSTSCNCRRNDLSRERMHAYNRQRALQGGRA